MVRQEDGRRGEELRKLQAENEELRRSLDAAREMELVSGKQIRELERKAVDAVKVWMKG